MRYEEAKTMMELYIISPNNKGFHSGLYAFVPTIVNISHTIGEYIYIERKICD